MAKEWHVAYYNGSAACVQILLSLVRVLYRMLPYVCLSGVGPIAFCDIVGTEEEDEDESLKGSKKNKDEARKAVSCRFSVHHITFFSFRRTHSIVF